MSFADTVIANYQSMHANGLDKFEQRPSRYGGLDLFQKQNAESEGILTAQDKENIKRSFGVPVQIPVVDYKNITIGNARTCNLQSEALDSAIINLVFVTYSWGFSMHPARNYENLVSYQNEFNRKMDAGIQALAATLDSQCITTLDNNLNQFYPQSILDFYAQTGNVLQVPQADKNDLYNNILSINETMDYYSSLDILNNPIHMAQVRRLAAQGAGNSENEAFQFLGYNWRSSNRVTNSAPTVESTMYSVVPGSVAYETRLDPDSKSRRRIHESKYWTVIPNAPLVGHDLGVYYQADCTDASALEATGTRLSGFTNTVVESWQMSHDACFVAVYNSDPATRFNPINKFEVLN